MTEKEAIEYLKSRYLVVGSPLNPPKEECERHNAVIDMAIHALEKCVPKKVMNKKALVDFCGRVYEERGDCPVCECPADKNYQDCCRLCGQKLDWGE